MQKLIKIIALLGLMLNYQLSIAETNNYRIHQGDVLEISVWGESELIKVVNVLPDGTVGFPLAGHVNVAGLSAREVSDQITEKLKKFLPDPEVTVIINSTAGNKIYVLGKVQRPGVIPLQGPLTVLQALSVSGGFDRFADQDEIKILRDQEILKVNYEHLVKGKNLKTNYFLRAGDTLLVP